MAGPRATTSRVLRWLIAIGVLATSTVAAAPANAGGDDPIQVFDARATGSGVQVSGTYTPLVGNFAGSAADDIFWYAPGPTADYLWIATGRGTFTKVATPVSGTYTPVVGDFVGDRYLDILWYAPGTTGDSMWKATGTAPYFTSSALAINGTYQPVVLDNTLPIPTAIRGGPSGLPKDVIIWYRPGTASDLRWYFATDGSFSTTPVDIAGSPILRPISIDANPWQDLLAYSPGSGPDALYVSDTGALIKQSRTVNGTYTPYVVGGGFYDEVLWHGPGSAADSRWANVEGTITSAATDPVTATGPLASMNQNAPSAYLYNATGADAHWSQGVVRDILDPDIGAGARPFVGDFDGDLGTDVFFYRPGSASDTLAYGDPVIIWS